MKASWFRVASILVLTAFGFALPTLAASPPVPATDEALALDPAAPAVSLDDLFAAESPAPTVVLNCSWADKPTLGCYYLWNPDTLCCRLSGTNPRCPRLICL